jgi:hypothetical protein
MNRSLPDRLKALGGTVLLLAMVAVLLLLALGFLAAALYLALARQLDPAWAALLTATAAVAMAGVIVLVVRVRRRPAPPAATAGRGLGGGAPIGLVSSLGAQFGEDTARLARAHAGKAVGLALALGFAVGVSPRLRRALWRLLQ